MSKKTDPTRKWHPEQEIPSIHELMDIASEVPELARLEPYALKQLARNYADWWRGRIPKLPEAPDREAIAHDFPDYVRAQVRGAYHPVINATGVLLHTNLGRAPFHPAIWKSIGNIVCGYTNLEYDVDEGERGLRDALVAARLHLLTGCEDAVIVNNNAAAVLLLLTALAKDKEVLVSRGELIEIGGKFRLPEVFEQSGAILVEVGTTNRTHLEDYIRACSDRTVAILRTHPSNYRIIGFSERPDLVVLSRWAHERGLQIWKDLGSGILDQAELNHLLPREPTVQLSLRRGCDIVCFSGDKILGGPQAGIIVGSAELCQKLHKHPLYRALRVDKITLALLERTLTLYLSPKDTQRVLTRRILTRSPESLRRVAINILQKLATNPPGQYKLNAMPDRAVVGGGLAPDVQLESWAIVIHGGDPERLHRNLRNYTVPIVGRIEKEQLWLNLHALLPGQEKILYQGLRKVLSSSTA